MFCYRFSALHLNKRFLVPNAVLAHSKSCPTRKKAPASKPLKPVCSPKDIGKGGGGSGGLTRALKSGKVRYGFIPDEWFRFFYPITGVSGPYLFAIVVGNYLLSKEIYVMEHEYYLGLSIFAAVYYVTTRFGRDIGKSLDQEVDAIQNEWEKGRTDEKNIYKTTVKAAEDAKARAEGQKTLMDAKKENITMQLEAIYRERLMTVYLKTRGRMDYHVKRHRIEAKVHQKWMIEWILASVRKSITPEFEQQAMNAAIQDLTSLAGKS